MLSSQIKSQREDADFWLVDGFQEGVRRCVEWESILRGWKT